MEEDKYTAQKKHLSEKRHQLRVWVEFDKYAKFEETVKNNNTSIYALINKFIDDYIENK